MGRVVTGAVLVTDQMDLHQNNEKIFYMSLAPLKELTRMNVTLIVMHVWKPIHSQGTKWLCF